MLKYQVFLISLVVILFSNQVLAETRINEAMYNPKGTDNYKEFVEIYSSNVIDLNNFTISDGDSEDKLVKLNNISSNYALIVETDYILNIPNNIALYSAGAAIGNGLSEDDKITLYDSSKQEIASMQIFKVDEGYSLEYFNGNYYKSKNINGTPGYENSIIEIPPESSDNESEDSTVDTTELNQNSTIEIKSVLPGDSIKFGENVSVEVSIYKGNTAKYAVYFYIEKGGKKITDKLSEYARTKYQNYTFKYSTQLKSNCDNKYEEGKYNIIIEGLDQYIIKEIDISGNIVPCENPETEIIEPLELESNTNKQEIVTETESNINQNIPVTGNIVYESSDIKAQRVALYLFCFVLILLTIYLIKRNKDGNNSQSNSGNSGFS